MLSPMATKPFQIGENVKLRSDGPQMTVVGYSENGETQCVWFDKEHKERRANFPAPALFRTPVEEITDAQLTAAIERLTQSRRGKPKKSPNRPEQRRIKAN
jgi:uncharacterized protein YodC (DUF2158 family)